MATPRTYQRVGATAGDYDGNVPFPARLVWDGVDDCLVVPTLDLSGTDKVTVVAGVTKLSDGVAAGIVCELSSSVTANTGAFYLIAPSGANTEISIASKGTIATSAKGVFPAPTAKILSCISNIAAPTLTFRVDGAVVQTSALSQGTGNYGAYPLYIGQRASTSLPFNGPMQSLTVIGNLLPDGEVKLLEDLTNKNMGKVY